MDENAAGAGAPSSSAAEGVEIAYFGRRSAGFDFLLAGLWMSGGIGLFGFIMLRFALGAGSMMEPEYLRLAVFCFGLLCAALALYALLYWAWVMSLRTSILVEPEMLRLRHGVFGRGRTLRIPAGAVRAVVMRREDRANRPWMPRVPCLRLRDGRTVDLLCHYSNFFGPPHGQEELRWLTRRLAAWAGASSPDVDDTHSNDGSALGTDAIPNAERNADTDARRSLWRTLIDRDIAEPADAPECARILRRIRPADAPPPPGSLASRFNGAMFGPGVYGFVLLAATLWCGWFVRQGWLSLSGVEGARPWPGALTAALIGLAAAGAAARRLWLCSRWRAHELWLLWEPGCLFWRPASEWSLGRPKTWTRIERGGVRSVERTLSPSEPQGWFAGIRIRMRDGNVHECPIKSAAGCDGIDDYARWLAAWAGVPLSRLDIDGRTPQPLILRSHPSGSPEAVFAEACLDPRGEAPFERSAELVTIPSSPEPMAVLYGMVTIMGGLLGLVMSILAPWPTRAGSVAEGVVAALLMLLTVGLAVFGGLLWRGEVRYRASWAFMLLEAQRLRWRPARGLALGFGTTRVRSFARADVRGVEIESCPHPLSKDERVWKLRLVFADQTTLEPLEKVAAPYARRESALWLAQRLAEWAGGDIAVVETKKRS